MFPERVTEAVNRAVMAVGDGDPSLASESKAALADLYPEGEIGRTPPIYLKKGGGRVSDKELEELGITLVRLISEGRQARQIKDMRVMEWRRRWDMIPRRRRRGPWKGSANYHSPLTRYTGETISARCKHITTGVFPYIRVRPNTMAESKDARAMERFIQSQLTEDVDFEDAMDTATDMAIRDGFCVLQPYWQYEVRKERDKVPLDQDLLRDLGYDYSQPLLPGVAVQIPGTNKFVMPGEEVDIEREVVTRNNIGIRVIDYMDFVVYPATARSIKSASLVGHRIYPTLDTLRHWVKDGLIDEKQLKKLEDSKPEVVSTDNSDQTGDPMQDMIEGLGGENAGRLDLHGSLEVYEVIYCWDHDGDGLEEDCLFRVEMSRRVVLAAQPWPYWRRERNYIPIVPFKRPNRLYGYAIGEILNDLQIQDNVVMNQSVDVGTMNLMPIIKEKKTSRTKWGSRQLELGEVQIVEEMDDFAIERFNMPTQQVIADRNAIREFSERLTAANESFQGVPTRGANTLGEVRDATQGGAMRLDVISGRIQRSVTQLARWIIALNRQFLDEDTEFALTGRGDRIFGKITKKQLRLRLSVKAHGNTLNSDRTLELQGAEKVLLFSERSPFMAGNLVKKYRAESYFLSFFTDEPEQFLGTEEEAQEMQERLENTPAQEEGDDKKWPTLSGKLDEMASLAILLNEKPELREALQEVMVMRRRAELAEAGNEALVGATKAIQQRMASDRGGTGGGKSGNGSGNNSGRKR